MDSPSEPNVALKSKTSGRKTSVSKLLVINDERSPCGRSSYNKSPVKFDRSPVRPLHGKLKCRDSIISATSKSSVVAGDSQGKRSPFKLSSDVFVRLSSPMRRRSPNRQVTTTPASCHENSCQDRRSSLKKKQNSLVSFVGNRRDSKGKLQRKDKTECFHFKHVV